ncbi:trimethylamine methyltransferase family protein [Chloroflexota bacterium]
MPLWEILSAEEIASIHQATLRVLDEVGVVVGHETTREMLVELGAQLRGDRVLMPPEMVERAVSISTGKVEIKGRGGNFLALGDGNLHWHNVGGARDVYLPDLQKTRAATIQDVKDSTRLLDSLEHASTITPFFTPQDVPGEIMSLAMYRYALPFTTKPLQGPGVQVAAEVKYVVEMAEVIGPVSEVLSMSVSPVSPLTFPSDITESMVEIARHGISFGPLPCPTAGTTAPLSIAGALTQQNAEVLASIVIVQAVNPGLPIIYCGRLAMMEPRTAISVWGGIELGIASAATVQIGHSYGLPVNVYGLSTNAHNFDIQNGYERALNAILPALAGADELSGIGEMSAGVMGAYAQMVCDNDIAASIKRARSGIVVNADSLAVDVITKVIASSRIFVGEKHTVDYLRAGEIIYTKLGERRSFEDWARSGYEGMAERAHAEAERILIEYEVPPLLEEQEKELDRILESAEKELSK